MRIDIDDLPVAEHAARLGRRGAQGLAEAYPLVSPTPGTLTSSIISLGLEAASFFREKAFPSAFALRPLYRLFGGYTTYGDCGGYNYDATCVEACFGFAPHLMDPFYCATCPEQRADPERNPGYNWHFVGTRNILGGTIEYMDREPDVCAGKDAWKWKIEGQCGSCQRSTVFRCHDGYKRGSDGILQPTICQGMVACDDNLTPCPPA